MEANFTKSLEKENKICWKSLFCCKMLWIKAIGGQVSAGM
jgi:hypothetical protein